MPDKIVTVGSAGNDTGTDRESTVGDDRSAPSAPSPPPATGAQSPPATGAAPRRGRTLDRGSDGSTLAELYDVALLDLDGVVYLGDDAVAGAVAAIARAHDAGLRTAYVTNNASRRPTEVAELLTSMGVPAGPADVVTSAQAAAHLLRDRLPPGSAVLVVGAPALADAIAECGLRPVHTAQEHPAAVVQGFDRGVGWAQLAEAAVALRAGAAWVATNADATLPSRRGPLPGTGSLVAALRTATGLEPLVVGKPEVQLHAEAVARTGAQRPLVVGDRLDTDILGATKAGADSLLVLTGISMPADLLVAPPDCRPTYVAAGLPALCAAQPTVVVSLGSVTCGGFRASADSPRGLVLESTVGDAATTDPLDALRSLCVAWWQLGEHAAGEGTSGGTGAAPAGAAPPVHATGAAVAAVEALGLRVA